MNRKRHRTAVGHTRLLAIAMVLAAAVTFLGAAPGAEAQCTSGCTIWPSTATPAIAADPDRSSIEVGVKFRSDVDGSITGIRFYKGSGNTGTHVGRLWTATGTQLASVTFTGETATGWQQANFATPVPITANTVYVASYHANVGRYSVTEPYFAAGVDNPPLHALAGGVSGGNGVYRYGAAAFPNQTYNSSNYWVDVVFTASTTGPPTVTSVTPASGATGVSTATTVTATFSKAMNASTINTGTFSLQGPTGPVSGAVSYNATSRVATLTPSAALATGATYTATVVGGASGVKDSSGTAMASNFVWSFTTATPAPPTVTSVTPASGATGVSTATTVTATFSNAMNAATINTGTFTLQGSVGTVSGTVSYNATTRVATLTPSGALAPGTTYTATVVGGASGVKDASGTAMASNFVWSFTTAAAAGSCPCTIWPSTATPAVPADPDTSAIEVGVKFRSDIDGSITGIRFYKGAGNTGTHVGNLWTAGGALLASVTFSGETATGWQQANFSTPVPIAANTVYVASYHAPVGRYSVTESSFAGAGVDNPPLHALSNSEAVGNGVYALGPSAFPTSTFNSTNYWVDVVFATTGPIPPTVTAVTPPSGATGVATGTTVTATFSKPMDPATISASTFTLQGPSSVPATVTYSAATQRATLTPNSSLASGTTYTATVRGTTTGVKDTSGTAMAANFVWSFATASGTGPCAPPANPIQCENSQPGNPKSQWDISGAGDPNIQGFATDISVNRGQTVRFKIDTPATSYRLDIYRMGYYNGAGARLVASILPSVGLPQNQPNCLSDSSTGLVDCGNWAESASWAVPSTATSGIYFAKLVRLDASGSSHIFFVVRDDSSTSDLLFQTSDTTWQAYNTYGGNSLYVGSPAGRAYKVSYNRPFSTRDGSTAQDWVFNAEYPMVRWLEANGYDVSYTTGVDSDRNGARIQQHKVFLSIGHDEYWSGTQRANVEAARNAGVHLAFFSGNEVFWKTRWETSIDGSGTAYRTLVCYKETHANANIDPSALWTGTWRDPRFSPPADGGRPENALTGTMFTVNGGLAQCCSLGIRVPAAQGKLRFWRNTSVANLAPGATATLPNGTLGYEWDEDLDNGFRPPGLFNLSTTSVSNVSLLLDYGSTYGTGTAIHSLTLYRHASGALVFGAGTVQWSWGLDGNHDVGSSTPDGRMQQATVNLLADMGAQPRTLQPGLVIATQSTDATAPTSVVTSPGNGANVATGQPVTITGTAADSGGGIVAVVEVSVDGGVTWRRASGTTSWSYTWVPTTPGTVTIGSSATDDSGNIQIPTTGVTVTVGGGGGGGGALLGQQVVLSQRDTESLGRGEAFPITANANGTVSSLSVYLDASSTVTRLVAGLYTNASNHPVTLLGQGSSTALTPGTWNTITIPGVNVTAGTTYWIAILGTGSGTLFFRDDPSGGCLSESSSQTGLTNLPATWATGSIWTGSCPLSAYGSP